MTTAEQQLLRRVADCDKSFGTREIHDPVDRERYDAEVRELQKLERKGWVTLRWNHMTHHGELYAASPLLTNEGRKALTE